MTLASVARLVPAHLAAAGADGTARWIEWLARHGRPPPTAAVPLALDLSRAALEAADAEDGAQFWGPLYSRAREPGALHETVRAACARAAECAGRPLDTLPHSDAGLLLSGVEREVVSLTLTPRWPSEQGAPGFAFLIVANARVYYRPSDTSPSARRGHAIALLGSMAVSAARSRWQTETVRYALEADDASLANPWDALVVTVFAPGRLWLEPAYPTEPMLIFTCAVDDAWDATVAGQGAVCRAPRPGPTRPTADPCVPSAAVPSVSLADLPLVDLVDLRVYESVGERLQRREAADNKWRAADRKVGLSWSMRLLMKDIEAIGIIADHVGLWPDASVSGRWHVTRAINPEKCGYYLVRAGLGHVRLVRVSRLNGESETCIHAHVLMFAHPTLGMLVLDGHHMYELCLTDPTVQCMRMWLKRHKSWTVDEVNGDLTGLAQRIVHTFGPPAVSVRDSALTACARVLGHKPHADLMCVKVRERLYPGMGPRK